MTHDSRRYAAIVLAIVSLTTLGVLTCEFNRPATLQTSSARIEHVAAAGSLTSLYTQSRLRPWEIRAAAAGANCDVLFIRTSLILEDSLIEAVHYGGGSYEVYPGGVQQFFRDRAFRGVAYQDASNRVWTYGDVSAAEAERMVACEARPDTTRSRNTER
jgi:hypothetical protein